MSDPVSPRQSVQEDSLPVPRGFHVPEELEEHLGDPQRILDFMNHNTTTADLALASYIARNIRKPSYGLKQFHDHFVSAFPELRYYCLSSHVGATTTGGTSGAEEYKRTIGAAFCVYWLMRIGIDGERGFCFGVDENWRPNPLPPGQSAPPGTFFQQSAEQRRLAFYFNAPWGRLNQLMVDAGLLRPASGSCLGGCRGGRDEWKVVEDRTVAMLVRGREALPGHPSLALPIALLSLAVPTPNVRLVARLLLCPPFPQVLTAIHDIMKNSRLLPVVQPQHAPYRGFLEGDQINDHDLALGYVLENYSEQLPSFHRLDARSQQTIKFTQVKFSFNHGWLVQAEAPPSALFTPFKTAIMEGGVREADVAFYFVHWLSDLAGAVPTPLQGSEKFVCHFPHFVLSSFIHSFPIVHQLASKSETQVLEDYLHTRWDERSAQEKTTVSSFVAVYVLHKRDRLEPTRKRKVGPRGPTRAIDYDPCK
jgi:hypothetical protein